MGRKYHHKHPYRREAEEDKTQKRRRWQCDDGDRDWNDVTTSQGIPGATRRLEEPRSGLSPRALLTP